MNTLTSASPSNVRAWLHAWLGPDATWLEISSAPTLMPGVSRETLGERIYCIEPTGLVYMLYTEWATAPTTTVLSGVLQRLAAGSPSGFAYLIGTCEQKAELIVGVALHGDGKPRLWRGTPQRIEADQSTLVSVPPVAADVSRETPEKRVLMAAGEAWRVLGRTRLSRRFLGEVRGLLAELSEGWEGGVDGRRQSLLLVCRVLFLAFVQDRGWLGGGRFLEGWLLGGGSGIWRERMLPLFGVLGGWWEGEVEGLSGLEEGVLGGGLFALEPGELSSEVGDGVLRRLLEAVLCRYRFVMREEGDGRCVDPEMLGQVFESWMTEEERGREGAYYTPPVLVDRLVRESLVEVLLSKGVVERREDAEWWLSRAVEGDVAGVQPVVAERVVRGIRSLRLLDPACGSGAFLVSSAGLLGRVLWLAGLASGERWSESDALGEVLSTVVHGIDRSRTACLLCTLRLWLLLASRADGGGVPLLPNLDHRIRQGNALLTPTTVSFREYVPLPPTLVEEWREALRSWSRARGRERERVGRRRDALSRALHRSRWEGVIKVRQVALEELEWELEKRDLFGGTGGRSAAAERRVRLARERLREAEGELASFDLERSCPFDPRVDFEEVFERGGFDVVVGNPPWVRLGDLSVAERRVLLDNYRWMKSSTDGVRVRGADGKAMRFGVQADLSVAFVEQSVQWLRPGTGVLGFVVPAKLLRAPYAAVMRDGLYRGTRLVRLEDLSTGGARLFDASVYPAVIVACRRPRELQGTLGVGEGEPAVRLGGFQGSEHLVLAEDLPIDGDPLSPWPLLPASQVRVLRALSRCARPMGRVVPVRMGIKTGANRVFLNPPVDVPELRPVLRGRDVHGESSGRLLFAHDPVTGEALLRVSPECDAYIEQHLARLDRRADVGPGDPAWSVFRVTPELLGHRVVWSDLSRALDPRVLAPVVDGGPLVLNTLYGFGAPEAERARRWAAWISSSPMQMLLAAWCEPALNGYLRFQSHVVGRIPFPLALLDEPGSGGWPDELDVLAMPFGEVAYDQGAVDELVIDVLPLDAQVKHQLRVACGDRASTVGSLAS